MPGKIKVKVLAGRNLPVMDRASDTTDAFVEIKFGSVTHKTDVCRKSLNPHWSSTEWYRFEVDESELQDEPLQLRLMDHDTYSANDAIGKVVISLAPLLAREANNAKGGAPPGAAVMSGWIPVFDTMHGIRGELNVIVKVELFSDFNKYKTSSCGVQFFHCPMIPPGYNVTAVHGFVEELVVNDDPEYQWIDKIRTPRASNEARQVAFIKLSNQVQRLVGLKAAELGANAVVGYQQDFDLEGEAGVVARAIGTAVSITPLSTPSQPLNIPPCTQQQLRKYLDILATDTDSITDLNLYFQHHQDELHKLLNILNPKTPTILDDGDNDNIDDDDKSLDLNRQPSGKSCTSELSIYQDDYVSQKSLKHISEDQIDLNKLLRRDDDSDSESSGPLQKIKKIKTNLFTKRFGSMRSRKSDKQDDQISIQSNSSDTSRISMPDIRNEFKKFKRLKKPKFAKVFANKQDEGVGMASILARSVIHVHTSLACIAENQDSEHSPSSTMRRTSESEPTINKSDDDKGVEKNIETKTDLLEIRRSSTDTHSSLKNINIRIYEDDAQPPQRKLSESCPATPMALRSENLLKLPNEAGYFGSLSLSGDSSVYSSSEEDDESSDQKTDNEKTVETTSSVVQSVLNHDVNPDIVAHMERKLSILEGVSPHGRESTNTGEKDDGNTSKPATTSDYLSPEKAVVTKSLSSPLPSDSKNIVTESQIDNNRHHFKFHNPFAHKKVSKTVSAPASPTEHHGFVYRSSKRIKRQLSKISKSKMLKSISHYSLKPKDKHIETKSSLSQPSSFSDSSSKAPSETVLGSPFLSYADLLSLDTDSSFSNRKPQQKVEEFHSRVKMYIGSEPASRASMSDPSSPYYRDEPHIFERKPHKQPALKPTGLVHTAMETILMDKVQSLLVPTSPEPIQSKEQRFFDDVNEKLEQVEVDRLTKVKTDGASQNLNKNKQSSNISFDNRSYNSQDSETDNVRQIKRNQSATSVDTKEGKRDGLIQTAMKTILMDKVQCLVSTDSEPILCSKTTHEVDSDHSSSPVSTGEIKHPGGMLQSAMKTILMDKVQSLVSTDSKPILCSKTTLVTDSDHSGTPVSAGEIKHPGGMLQSAMETILIDKVQSLVSTDSEPILGSKTTREVDSDHSGTPVSASEIKHPGGMLQSAMEIILIDKVQSLVSTDSEPILGSKTTREVDSDHSGTPVSASEIKHPGGMLQSAMETILIDKVQSLVSTDSEPILGSKTTREVDSDHSGTPVSASEIKHPGGMLQSAMETILIDKVQSLVSTDSEPILGSKTTREVDSDHSGTPVSASEIKHPGGMLQSAMETILIDKVQSLVSTDSEPVLCSETLHDPVVDKCEISVSADEVQPPGGMLQSATETILMDKAQTLVSPSIAESIEEPGSHPAPECKDNNQNSLLKSAMQTMLIDTVQSLLISPDPSITEKDSDTKTNENTTSQDKKDKKLLRQDSIHSLPETCEESRKMSKELDSNIVVPCKMSQDKPFLKHFHPILSGAPLETIPSLPETSFDRSESLDVEGVERTCDCRPSECDSETNSASVCDNSHAACRFDRSDRDRDQYEEREQSSPQHARHESYGGREPMAASPPPNPSLNASSTPVGIHRRSSDSDLSITPKGGSLNTSGNAGSGGGAILRPSMNSNNLDMLEYPFLTMSEYPSGFIVHIGGTVCARSVKLVDPDGESTARAAWWAELRTELRAHARALRCNAVIAYSESAAICEDVCVLSASGTAAVINLDCEFTIDSDVHNSAESSVSKTGIDELEPESCTIAHVPYSPGTGPYRAELSTCGGCRRCRVPSVLLATCTKPNRLASYSKAVTLTAVAARVRRAPPAAEPGARDISDQLPFLEYELHKLLVAKLRMQGANALFSLQTQIAIGERCVMALASGTAFRLAALPPPTPPKIRATENEKDALEIQKKLWDSFTANKAANGYDIGIPEHPTGGPLPETEAEAEAPALDLCADKDTCVLELDETEDVETAKVLAVRRLHMQMQVYTNSLKPAPTVPPHAFAQVLRARLVISGQGLGASMAAEKHVSRALDGVTYKLRRLQPCALVAPRFQIELPEDEIQLIVSGTAIPLQDAVKTEQNSADTSQYSNGRCGSAGNNSQGSGSGDADDDIFALDEDQLAKPSHSDAGEDKHALMNGQPPTATSVSLTTLSSVSGARGVRRVCALRLLFVRETTAVRELGGLSGFLHTVTCEVLAIVRAYTAALGGNALTSFYITQLMLQDNAHKNQGQCLLSVGGDVVCITY